MHFYKVLVLIAVLCSNIPYGNSASSFIKEIMDEIKTTTKVWNDEKIGKSFEYLIRFRLTSFLDALQFCRSINYQLLAIDSEEEFQFIRSELLAGNTAQFWTSGIDIIPNSTAGQQIWATNGLPVLPTLLLPGEPDDYLDTLEICLGLHYTHPLSAGYYLRDVTCDNGHYVICKIELKA